MWVYAFWRTDTAAQLDAGLDLLTSSGEPRLRDPFIRCHGPGGTLALPLPDVLATPYEEVYLGDVPRPVGPTGDAVERLRYLEHTLDAGRSILAGICLGTVDTVYADLRGDYWFATTPDLTRKGRKLVRLVSELYGDRPHRLLTYVDT